jgi:hypothetical protein
MDLIRNIDWIQTSSFPKQYDSSGPRLQTRNELDFISSQSQSQSLVMTLNQNIYQEEKIFALNFLTIYIKMHFSVPIACTDDG